MKITMYSVLFVSQYFFILLSAVCTVSRYRKMCCIRTSKWVHLKRNQKSWQFWCQQFGCQHGQPFVSQPIFINFSDATRTIYHRPLLLLQVRTAVRLWLRERLATSCPPSKPCLTQSREKGKVTRSHPRPSAQPPVWHSALWIRVPVQQRLWCSPEQGWEK